MQDRVNCQKLRDNQHSYANSAILTILFGQNVPSVFSRFSHGQRYVAGSARRSFAAGDLSHSASPTGYKTQSTNDNNNNKSINKNYDDETTTTRTTTTNRSNTILPTTTNNNKQQQCGQEIHLVTPNGPKMLQTLGPLPVMVATGSLKTTLAMSRLGQQPKA
jgi:hypothetical protein